MNRNEIEALTARTFGASVGRADVQALALLGAVLEELRALRLDLRSATPNDGKSEKQREVEAAIGQSLEEFFRDHGGGECG